MAKNNKWIFIAILALIVIGMFIQQNYNVFSVSGSETMTRTASSSIVNPSSTFSLTYTAIGTSGTWGASIVDSVSGGCKFPDGTTQLKSVMLSPDGNTKTITITTPSSGSCTFTGDYQYGTASIKTFPSLTISVCSASCLRPSDLCLSTSSNGCGGTCSWSVTKKTDADANCNNLVDRTELGNQIIKWINGQVDRTKLGEFIMAWIG